MPRTKKSARILELTGAYKKNPQRKNHNEPVVESLTEADIPAGLNPQERDAFKRLMDYMPPGVYTVAEIPLLTMAARYQTQFDNDPEEFPASKASLLTKCLIHLGMTPGGRSKLTVPKAGEKNKFDE